MLVAVTNSDETNMVACQIAYSLFNTPNRIARIRSSEYIRESEKFFHPEAVLIDHLISPAQRKRAGISPCQKKYRPRILISPDITGVRTTMAKRYSLIERQQHIDAWQRSGLTKQEYCQQNTLATSAFYYWLKHHNPDASTDLTPAFIPVRRVAVENNRADTVTLNLPNGDSISCLPAQLKGVMQALSLC